MPVPGLIFFFKFHDQLFGYSKIVPSMIAVVVFRAFLSEKVISMCRNDYYRQEIW